MIVHEFLQSEYLKHLQIDNICTAENIILYRVIPVNVTNLFF